MLTIFLFRLLNLFYQNAKLFHPNTFFCINNNNNVLATIIMYTCTNYY